MTSDTDKEWILMTWNYRITRFWESDPFINYFETEDDEDELYPVYEMRAVFYDDALEINFWTEDPTTLLGTSHEELLSDFEKFKEAFDKPVLEFRLIDEDNWWLFETNEYIKSK